MLTQEQRDEAPVTSVQRWLQRVYPDANAGWLWDEACEALIMAVAQVEAQYARARVHGSELGSGGQ